MRWNKVFFLIWKLSADTYHFGLTIRSYSFWVSFLVQSNPTNFHRGREKQLPFHTFLQQARVQRKFLFLSWIYNPSRNHRYEEIEIRVRLSDYLLCFAVQCWKPSQATIGTHPIQVVKSTPTVLCC